MEGQQHGGGFEGSSHPSIRDRQSMAGVFKERCRGTHGGSGSLLNLSEGEDVFAT